MKQNAFTVLSLLLILTLGLSISNAEDGEVMQDAGPDGPPPSMGKPGDALTPLVIGNTWVYESVDDNLITTDRIEGVVLFDKQPWHLLRTYEREKGQPEQADASIGFDLWVALIDGHECDAFTTIGEETDELKLSTIGKYYRYPATLGETYRPNPTDNPDTTLTVAGVNEEVTTKAGAFTCVVYKETSAEDPDYTFTTYVAPGIGVVKAITTDADGTYTSELVRYTLVERKK